MFDAAQIIGLYAETPLHPGAGASTGAIDLPVQRERHTALPLIQATSIKGVLRDLAERKYPEGANAAKILEVFGPNVGGGDSHGGALSPTDARLLLFPVRSLEGLFVWTTCPFVIDRLARDLSFVNDLHKLGSLPTFKIDSGKALIGQNSLLKSQKPLID